MSFKMIYDARNRTNLDKLADNTKIKAYELYQYCIDNKIPILIYETIRTKATQAEYVKQGKSKTMNSWHLTGQALDWVLVDSKGSALWNGYKTTNGLKVINYAKSIGFTSGHDWGWDSPHLQYDKIKYGKDTFGKVVIEKGDLSMSQYNELKKMIDDLQKQLNQKERSPQSHHKEAWEWLVKEGLSDGTNPQNHLTREQFASLLHRYHQKFVAK